MNRPFVACGLILFGVSAVSATHFLNSKADSMKHREMYADKKDLYQFTSQQDIAVHIAKSQQDVAAYLAKSREDMAAYEARHMIDSKVASAAHEREK